MMPGQRLPRNLLGQAALSLRLAPSYLSHAYDYDGVKRPPHQPDLGFVSWLRLREGDQASLSCYQPQIATGPQPGPATDLLRDRRALWQVQLRCRMLMRAKTLGRLPS